ncbi:hypothetical protein [Kitasatospora sp. NPDC006786]|uniref:hypothetical protein n=1 Tax=unclassified Kitasatospora TaxID=2633591 RepID=UPI0033F51D60
MNGRTITSVPWRPFQAANLMATLEVALAHRRRKRRKTARNTPVIKPASRKPSWLARVMPALPALPVVVKVVGAVFRAFFDDNHMGPGPM